MANSWASRVMTYGSDHLERWAWVTLRGRKDERLKIAAMYRPNPGYSTDGTTTVWSQQQVRLQELAMDNNNMIKVDLREQ